MTDQAAETHETKIDNSNRSTTPQNASFLDFISSQWSERNDVLPTETPAATFARARREAISAKFPGKRLVLAAGVLKQRSNDTFYPFRAHSAFAHWSSRSPRMRWSSAACRRVSKTSSR